MAVTTARSGSPKASAAAILAFVRFVIFGGGVTLLGSGALLLVGDRVPFVTANAVVTVVTTVLATELHGRFTFGRGGATWSDHCASGLTVLVSYLFTTGALLAFDGLHPHSGALLRQGVYLAASGLAGVGRFLVLRLVVFANARTGPAVDALKGAQGMGRGAVTVAA
jgi:putative flippase GtrA